MTPDALSFLSGANADFLAELYARYAENPSSVDPGWQGFFAGLGESAPGVLRDLKGASWAPSPAGRVIQNGHAQPPAAPRDSATAAAKSAAPTAAPGPDGAPNPAILDSVRAIMYIRAMRVCGHLVANLDPLGLTPPAPQLEVDPTSYGFAENDMDRPIFIDGILGRQTATMREIVATLRRTYCGSIGVEFMHIQDPAQKSWIQERVEGSQNTPAFDASTRRHMLERLTAAETFEKFLHVKFPGTKRFGLDGGESLIPALETLIATGAAEGLREVVVGMAHRGRLNMLTNFLNKPFKAMFSEFLGTPPSPDGVQGSGDVKYHLGASTDRDFNGIAVHLTMNPNPSHLEWVNPVVTGRVRAKQQQRAGSTTLNSVARRQVMGLLLHGDAAFAGQGVIMETLMMSELKGYGTGGTMHVVINNQVGFTTSPHYSRSGVYCTDVAKMIQAPVFHVNADDVDAVAHVARLAASFRQTFFKDVVIDLVCYRRHGHNEGDEPAFTQPVMYRKIRAQPTTREIYARRLVEDKVLSQAEADAIQTDFLARLEQDFQAAAGYKPDKADWLEGRWSGFERASGEERGGATGVDLGHLRDIGRALARIPDAFDINPKIAKQMEARRAMVESGQDVDWAMAEAMAFGSLLVEGTHVRLSGQDSGRGTFSQRHSKLYDQTTEKRYVPLNNLRQDQAVYEVHNSPLSEAAVMGFDYGFSLAEPDALVCWEGQFGDFANGAQIIIDQFIASAEAKWLRMSGLVLLLPHGYEGQGPEHSSARLERFLQLCGDDNWQVANCTTPANYFHILRRQVRRSFRKPLVLMTPKSLLRHKLCVSRLEEFGSNTRFHRVLGDATPGMAEDSRIRRVVLCSGKVYYDLLALRTERAIRDVALVRLEQFYPFPDQPLQKELGRYPNADVVWCQEEPGNMGGWHFVDRRLEDALAAIRHKAGRPRCVSRPEAASPASGSLKKHNKEQAELLESALIRVT